MILKNVSDTKKRILTIFLSVFVLFLTALIIVYIYFALAVHKSQNRSIDADINSNFDIIESYLTNLYKEAQISATAAARDIERELKKEYPDLSVLSDELDNDNYSAITSICLDKLRHRYLNEVNNQWNSIFVGTNKYILYDYNYHYSITTNEEKKKGARFNIWKNYVADDYNHEASEYVLDKLLTNPDDDILIIEPQKSTVKDHMTLTQITLFGLRDVYKNEGLEGLKNYIMLAPAYVEESEDIFGNEEIVSGVYQDTYRLIVIQRCSIYDQIMANYPEIKNLEETISVEEEENAKVNHNIELVGIFMALLWIGGVIQACTFFNECIINGNNNTEDEDDSEESIIDE